jgi:hypothetical protein
MAGLGFRHFQVGIRVHYALSGNTGFLRFIATGSDILRYVYAGHVGSSAERGH